MPKRPAAECSGLLLPPGVVQPFFLRFRRDDLHVMAAFEEHPKYEAVEAMIKRRPHGEFSIRAILTAHDQSQIDHVNDDALLSEMRGAQREICRRAIDVKLSQQCGKSSARIEFVSLAGERVNFEITAVGQPDRARGGLSDPGGHSATTTLPIMWRGASALAGPETRVHIDGVQYEVPVKIRRDSFVAHEGYYTEVHSMAVIRAGVVTMRLVEKPDRPDVGAKWRFENEGQTLDYCVTERTTGGELRIAKLDATGETITARLMHDRLDVTEIKLPVAVASQEGLALRFDGSGGFQISVEEAENIVSGRAAVTESSDLSSIQLSPVHPSWARRRAVRIACAREGDLFKFASAIG
jgi:hypothetical protein